MTNISENIIFSDENIQTATKKLQNAKKKILVVLDSNETLIGTVTDGDIRRAIIKSLDLNMRVDSVMNTNPVFSYEHNIRETINNLSLDDFYYLPIVNSERKILEIKKIQDFKDIEYENTVMILAGGFGNRLMPLTKETPKPLLKIGDTPILEIIIKQFAEKGFRNFYISTHYMADQIEKYFKDGSNLGVNIKYTHEEKPLGTAGSLGLLPKSIADLPVIVINGDLLTKLDFAKLLEFHSNHNSEITVSARDYEYEVPFGVLETSDETLIDIKEKPIYKSLINAGVYVIDKNLLNDFDGESYIDMTSYIKNNLNKKKINVFPIHEYWLDIGRIEEFKKANSDVELFS